MSTADVIASASDLLSSHYALLERVRSSRVANGRALRAYTNSIAYESHPEESDPLNVLLNLPPLPTIQSPPRTPSPEQTPDLLESGPLSQPQASVFRSDLPAAKRARCARYVNYVPEEETIRNDYSQRYVDGGEWPQNWVVGAEMERRFEEYPKQQRLLSLKKMAVAEYSLPPMYISMSSAKNALQGLKFDTILIDPPFSSSFTWDQLDALPIATLAADPSFVFLWVGSGAGDGLERGREIIGRWGYRRCEDIVWVKTNKESNRGPGTDPPTTSLLTRTKQHCLMGIRGTVRRSTDSWFVHCNIDTDVIIWEGDPLDPTRKPPEMYQLIENFCLGTRRLEIFGRYHSLRRGWVTVTAEELNLSPEEVHEKDNAVPFDREKWESQIKALMVNGKCVVPNTSEIESLRPKSPPPRAGAPGNSVITSTVSASMSTATTNLQSNHSRSGTSGGVAVGIMNGAGSSSGPRRSFNSSMISQPMNVMGVNSMGNVGSVPGMGGAIDGIPMIPGAMGDMNNVHGMGDVAGMGQGMAWQMSGAGIGAGMPGNMVNNMGNMMMNNMGMTMNASLGGGRGSPFNTGFEGSAPNAMAGMRGPGMMPISSSMNHSMSGNDLSQIGGGMGMGAGVGHQLQMGFGRGFDVGGAGQWMGPGQGNFDSRGNPRQHFFVGSGGMWNGGELECNMGGMGMGSMGMNQNMVQNSGQGMGQGMGQNAGMRQWGGF